MLPHTLPHLLAHSTAHTSEQKSKSLPSRRAQHTHAPLHTALPLYWLPHRQPSPVPGAPPYATRVPTFPHARTATAAGLRRLTHAHSAGGCFTLMGAALRHLPAKRVPRPGAARGSRMPGDLATALISLHRISTALPTDAADVYTRTTCWRTYSSVDWRRALLPLLHNGGLLYHHVPVPHPRCL